jgi:hypothetical protein
MNQKTAINAATSHDVLTTAMTNRTAQTPR